MPASGAELKFLLRMRDDASRVVRGAAKQMRALGTTSQKVGKDVKGVSHKMTELNQSIELMRRTMGFFKQTMGASLKAFSDYNKAMTIVQRVTDKSKAEIADFSDEFDDMVSRVKALPVSRISEISAQAAQLGLVATDDIIKFTEVIGQLESSLVDLGTDAPKLMARVLNATGEGIEGIDKFANVLVRMAKAATASESRILHMAAEIGNATARFGIAAEDLLGIATAASDFNFKPELFGTGMARIMTQLDTAARSNSAAMRSLTDTTNITAEAMRDLIAINPAEAFLLLADVVGAINEAGGNSKAFLTELKLNATELEKVLQTVAKNTEEFRERLGASRKEALFQTAMSQEFATTLEAFFVKVQEAENAWVLFKKEFGRALAPLATDVLDKFTDAVNWMAEALKDMPRWLSQTIVWMTLLVPAVIAAVIAIKALGVALSIIGGVGVARALKIVAGGIAFLSKGVIALTAYQHILKATAAFLLLGGRAVVGAITTATAATVAWAASLLRVTIGVGALAAFTGVLAAIGTAFVWVGGIIATVVAAIAAAPLLLISAVVASIAAVTGLFAAIYRKWDEVSAAFDVSWVEFGKSIGSAIKEGVTDAFDWLAEQTVNLVSGNLFSGGELDLDDVREFLRDAKEQRETLIDILKRAEDMPGLSQEVRDILAGTAANLDEYIEKVQALADSATGGGSLAGIDLKEFNLDKIISEIDDKLFVGITADIDASKLSKLSIENTKILQDLDEFTDAMAELNLQKAALTQAGKLLPTDSFFTKLGLLTPEEVDAYIARLKGLYDVEFRNVDPVNTRLDELTEELFAVEAITGASKNQLEVETLILGEKKKRGDLEVHQAQALGDVMRQIQAARRVSAVDQAVFDFTGEIVAAQALTKAQKNRAEITQHILDMEHELGEFSKDQVDQVERLTAAMERLQDTQQAAAFHKQTTNLNNQLLLISAMSRADSNRLTVLQQINQIEKSNGDFKEGQREQLERQLTALQAIHNIQFTVGRLDPQAAALRQYNDDLGTLRVALDSAVISQEYYNQLIGQLEIRAEKTLDPLFRMKQAIADNVAAQSIMGPGAKVERDILKQVNTLRRQGLEVTDQQVDAIREMHQAMENLKLVQTSGLEGWADSLGTLTERILDMQASIAEGFSSSLVDALYGDEDAWANFFMDLSRQSTRILIDGMMQDLANWIGNDLGGLLNVPTQDSAVAEAEAAQQKLDNVLTQIVSANTVNLTARTLNLEDFAQGALGDPTLGAPTNVQGGNPLFNLDGASSKTSVNATKVMGDLLAGPFKEMQNQFGQTLTVIDAIAKQGTSREQNTPNSQHFSGTALDISLAGMSDTEKQQLVQAALQSGFTGLGFGESTLHVDQGDRRAWDYGNEQFGGKSTEEMIAMVKAFQPPPQPQVQAVGGAVAEGGASQDLLTGKQELEQVWRDVAEAARMAGADLRGQAGDTHAIAEGGASQDLIVNTQESAQVWQDVARKAAEELRRLAESTQAVGETANKSGAQVTQMGNTAIQAGSQVQRASTSIGTLGISASTARTGVDAAATVCTTLGREARTAAPQLDAAADALRNVGGAGAGVGGGVGGGGGGGGGGFLSGDIGNALVFAGISLVTGALSSRLNKNKGDTSDSNPNLEVFDEFDRIVSKIDHAGKEWFAAPQALDRSEAQVRAERENSDMIGHYAHYAATAAGSAEGAA